MPVSLLFRLCDLIAPRQCPICGSRLAVEESPLCAHCDRRLPRAGHIAAPYDNEMAHVLWGRVRNPGMAVALLRFQHGSQSSFPVYDFKYGRRPDLAEAMGLMLGREMAEAGLTDAVDVIVPVPLTRKRERWRGYNQSLLIAEGVREACGKPVERHALRRSAFSESLTHKDRWRRQASVADAFTLGKAGAVNGRHVLLVDDILTTGATALACAAELERGGAAMVSVAAIGFAGGAL